MELWVVNLDGIDLRQTKPDLVMRQDGPFVVGDPGPPEVESR